MNTTDSSWSPEKTARLLEMAKTSSVTDMARTFHMPTSQIRSILREHGITPAHMSHVWTNEEVELLRELGPSHTTTELADILFLDRKVVWYKLKEQNIPYISNSREWTPEEEVKLRELGESNHTLSEISDIMGCPKTCAKYAMNSRGIPYANDREVWTPDKVEAFIRLAPTHTKKELAEMLGFAPSSIYAKSRELNIPYANRSHRKFWTEDEIEMLRNLAPDYTSEEISIMMRRPENMVKSKAKENNITCKPKAKAESNVWTREKVELLKQLAPNHTKNELVELLGIPRSTISVELNRLGISCQKAIASKWTEEQSEKLRELAASYNTKEIALMMGYSSTTIATKMREMGLSASEGKVERWADEDVERLKALAGERTPISEIAQMLGRSESAVIQKIRMLGLFPLYAKKNNRLTPEDAERLREQSKVHTAKELSAIFGWSQGIVRARLEELGLTCVSGHRRWTRDELDHLRELAPTCTLHELCGIFGRSESSVSMKLRELGITSAQETQ